MQAGILFKIKFDKTIFIMKKRINKIVGNRAKGQI